MRKIQVDYAKINGHAHVRRTNLLRHFKFKNINFIKNKIIQTISFVSL